MTTMRAEGTSQRPTPCASPWTGHGGPVLGVGTALYALPAAASGGPGASSTQSSDGG